MIVTKDQYLASIKALGLSQQAAGEFFGYSKRQGQRWANSERPIPVAVAISVRLMIESGKMPGDIPGR